LINKDEEGTETIKSGKILTEINKLMKLGRMLAESEPFPTIKPVGLRSNRKRTNETPLKKRNSEGL
jgi:hypothetical protein